MVLVVVRKDTLVSAILMENAVQLGGESKSIIVLLMCLTIFVDTVAEDMMTMAMATVTEDVKKHLDAVTVTLPRSSQVAQKQVQSRLPVSHQSRVQ